MKQRRLVAFGPLQLAVAMGLVTAFAGPAETCTRALYVGEDGLVITGRSMDWGEDMAFEPVGVPAGQLQHSVATWLMTERLDDAKQERII